MKTKHKRKLVVTLICVFWTVLVAILYFSGFIPLLKSELEVQDFRASRGQKAEVNSQLLFIGISKVSYRDVPLEQDQDARESPVLQKLQGPYPWSRSVWAELIGKLAEAGAKVIVLDLVFASEGAEDDSLAATLDKYKDRVVIASNISDFRESAGTVQEGVALSLTLPSASVIAVPAGESAAFDPRVGFANIWPDWDGVFRRPRFRISHNELSGFPDDRIHESLAARTLRSLGLAGVIPPVDDEKRIRFAAPPGEGFQPIALDSIFRPKIWVNNYKNGEFFRDKIIFVGPAANVFHDEHRTPFPRELMLGPEVHLNIINAALQGAFLLETSPRVNFTLLFFAGFLAALLCRKVPQPVKRVVLILVLSFIWWFLADALFNHAGLLTVTVGPLLILNGSGISALVHDFVIEQVERARVRQTLERYVSKNIVQELLDNPQTYFQTLGGVRRPVTVMFSDVRNFTTMTESADEEQLVLQLNEYFTEMVRHVFDNNGTLDKFIGDAVMAVWGNIVSHGKATDAKDAVKTALEMKLSLIKLNAGWQQRGWPVLAFGIGINHGEAVVANLGSVQKMELSVIGDAINLASRLEGLTKEFHLDLLIGETVAALVQDRYLLRPVHLVQVKGKTRPVEVFEVLGERGTSEGSETPWLSAYLQGLQLYRNRQFAPALQAFELVLLSKPDDYITLLYVRDCHDFIKEPPPPDWNGVFVMKSK